MPMYGRLYITVKAVNSFLVTQRQVTLKDVCRYVMLESFKVHVCRTLS